MTTFKEAQIIIGIDPDLEKSCCGVVTMELELDHIVNIAQGGNDDESNLQSLCVPCHKEKTLKESRQ